MAGLFGCARPPETPAPQACTPIPPPTASYMYPRPEPVADLAGAYRLLQVQTQPDGPQTSAGVLHLHLADSAEQHARAFARFDGLVGWYEPEHTTTQWRAIVEPRDPERPGAQVQGQTLRIGMNNVLDGAADVFTITAQNQAGLWGWWMADNGIAIPVGPHPQPIRAGYFCAYRVPAGS